MNWKNIVFWLFITLIVLPCAIGLCAWLRKKFNKRLKIEPIDIGLIAFIFISCLFVFGKITNFKVAGIVEAGNEEREKIEKLANEKIKEIEEQQKIAMLWLQVLDAENIREPETAIGCLEQILSKEKSWQVYDHLGDAYKDLAKKYKSEEKKRGYLEKSRVAFVKASELGNNATAVNVADIYAYFNEEEKCKEWLLKAQSSNKLPTYDEILSTDWLSKYSSKPWFKELKWKEYK